jgi:hypothetical protein
MIFVSENHSLIGNFSPRKEVGGLSVESEVIAGLCCSSRKCSNDLIDEGVN